MATTLQPYPLSPGHISPAPTLQALGELILARNLSTRSAAAAGITSRLSHKQLAALWSPADSASAAHEAVIRWRSHDGIIRLVPDDDTLAVYDGHAEDIGLLNGFRLPVEELLTHNPRKTLVLSSPNSISGQVATVQEIVRLLRHFSLVVIDERLATFGMRRLTPLVSEWENLISVQRFPFLMPGETSGFGWVLHPQGLQHQLAEHLEQVQSSSVEEALAYGRLDPFRAERLISRRKSQLYRELRKLSILSVPYPSWSNSLLARIERGDRDQIVAALADQGIAIYAPPHANLRQHVRITAIDNPASLRLRDALVEINRDLE